MSEESMPSDFIPQDEDQLANNHIVRLYFTFPNGEKHFVKEWSSKRALLKEHGMDCRFAGLNHWYRHYLSFEYIRVPKKIRYNKNGTIKKFQSRRKNLKPNQRCNELNQDDVNACLTSCPQ